MKLTLAENIRSFRKERRYTQEQLAEILGVTAGAVYKWESGQSVPELGLLVEMADFFDVSVDALLGYRMKDNRIEATKQRLDEYVRNRDPQALAEAEKALQPLEGSSVRTDNVLASVYGENGHICSDLQRTDDVLRFYQKEYELRNRPLR